MDAGLVTVDAFDDLDWDDELRIRRRGAGGVSPPDGLTGMEANLRFPGPETMETKIFGRLSGVAELGVPATQRGQARPARLKSLRHRRFDRDYDHRRV